nr:immunoglobulin light chain junction region [Macaca mulatta]MOX33961.1 immunoglobulin light chain junction region [Macaca mulatta]
DYYCSSYAISYTLF